MEGKEMLINEVVQLVHDLGWDYERMSTSGKGVYNELCDLLGIE